MNRALLKILTSAVITLMLPVMVWAQSDLVTWKISKEQADGDIFEIVFTADIRSSWHMYDMGPYEDGPLATSITVKPMSGAELVGQVYATSKARRVMDEVFGMEIGYFEDRATFVQRVKMTAAKAVLRASAEWMVCNDSSCMPPSDAEFDVEISFPGFTKSDASSGATTPQRSTDPNITVATDAKAAKPTVTPISAAVAGQQAAVQQDNNNVATSVVLEKADTTISDNATTGNTADNVAATGDGRGERSIWRFILEAILWGLAALLTPCVFPMIPMTISFFLKSQGSPAKGRFLASMYGLFIISLYTLPIVVLILVSNLVGGADMTAGFFNWLSTHWVPNVLFFLVFFIFAASFFGAFEITLPSRLVNKSDSKADKGGIIGTFFMALTLVLVSFSCTGPIVGTVLIKSSQGEVWTPVFTMLAFSVTFAIPFTLFAIFPSLMNRLKSGSWLNSVKVSLGFIEVALGLKFLSIADQTYHWGILDREVYLALWIVTFSLLGVYLLGKIKFKHDSDLKYISVSRLFLAILTFSFVAYMIPGMWGAPLKGLSGYLPPISTQDFVIGQGTAVQIRSDKPLDVKYADKLHLPHSLEGFFDLGQAQQYADEVGKPLFIDITGHGCVNCREMEQRVWADSRVLELLREQFVIVALYTDDKLTARPEDWITTASGKELRQIGKINTYKANTLFGVSAQPFYIITGRGGKRLADHQYDLNIDNFVDFLNRGIGAFKAEL